MYTTTQANPNTYRSDRVQEIAQHSTYGCGWCVQALMLWSVGLTLSFVLLDRCVGVDVRCVDISVFDTFLRPQSCKPVGASPPPCSLGLCAIAAVAQGEKGIRALPDLHGSGVVQRPIHGSACECANSPPHSAMAGTAVSPEL
eukprot:2592536-Alexandrium_andersonii.AAC.1